LVRHKLSAALQLGPAALARRARWRLTQLVRVFWSALRRNGACADFVTQAEKALNEFPLACYLPSSAEVRDCYSRFGDAGRASAKRIASAAEEVIADRVTIRGIGELELRFEASDWYAYAPADAIMVNRHDFLLPLAQNYVLADCPRSRDKIRQLFAYWVDNFDRAALIRSDTPIDAAIRLINWLFAFNCGALELDNEEKRRLLRTIYLQLEYIYCRFSAGGNHLVLEALALYLYGGVFRDTSSGANRKVWAREVLIKELVRQTTADGVHTEQSMFYHQAVSTHFLKFFLGARHFGDVTRPATHERFEAMLDYIHTSAMPDGTHPVVGDGESLTTADREHWEARGLLAARWALFDKPVDAALVDRIDDSSIWLLACSRTDVAVAEGPRESKVFRDSGLAVFRDRDAYVFIDAAPFSDPEFPHHGHADALSFVACGPAGQLLIDPGGYGYYDDKFRRFFRSTAAHNTIEINGENQSQLFGVLGYGRLASTVVEDFYCSEAFDYLRATHDGYAPVSHTRTLFLCKNPRNTLIILDRLTGSGSHRCVSRFHAAPGVTINNQEKQLLMTKSFDVFHFAIAASMDLEQRVVRARSDGEVQGWVSPETREVTAADTLELECNISGHCTLLVAIGLESDEPVSAKLDANSHATVSVAGEVISLTREKGAGALQIENYDY
jgi:uncharacterized heparinase superfamily protein